MRQLLHALLVLLPHVHGPFLAAAERPVRGEYLRSGSKKFFFNTCQCGLIDGRLQDLKYVAGGKAPVQWTREQIAILLKMFLFLVISENDKRKIAKERRKAVGLGP